MLDGLGRLFLEILVLPAFPQVAQTHVFVEDSPPLITHALVAVAEHSVLGAHAKLNAYGPELFQERGKIRLIPTRLVAGQTIFHSVLRRRGEEKYRNAARHFVYFLYHARLARVYVHNA